MVRLAVPVVVAELGWVAMGIVDIVMVGRLGPEAIGAVGVSSMLFLAVVVFGIGMLLGLDTFVSQAFGAGRFQDCERWLCHGVSLALFLTLPLMVVNLVVIAMLDQWGFDPAVLQLATPYFTKILWGTLPLLLYTVFRRFLQAIGLAFPVMAALVSANVINVITNWVLIFGHLGLPALGVDGAAWATVISRVYLALFLGITILIPGRRSRPVGWRGWPPIEWAAMGRLVRFGVPSAIQMTLEVGVFAVVSALAGRFEPATLAAHHIVLNIASVTFMVPFGVGSAGAVRVGYAVGRCDPPGARHAGWAALTLGTAFMSCAALTFVLVPQPILRWFTADVAVVAVGVPLLFVVALFQLSDGLQAVATGVLRGFGDTRTAMLWNLAGHWFIGLPVGYVLCFVWEQGVIGLWAGLSVSLTLVGVILVITWWSRSCAWMPGKTVANEVE